MLVLAVASGPAHAAPRGARAKAAFDRGVAAYQAEDYAAAAAALEQSYTLEPDVETLFAWAQAERQQDHCDEALALYDKLLAQDLPEANKRVIRERRDECQAIVDARAEPVEPEEPTPAPVAPVRPEPPPGPEDPSWVDPIGAPLLAVGVLGLGAGGYFLVSARGADSDAKVATNYFEVERLNDRADSHGRIGVIATLAGGALLAAGIVRYATRGSPERATVTGWLAPGGGGLVALGRF